MDFNAWLRSHGVNPETVDEATKATMRKIFDESEKLRASVPAPQVKPPGDGDTAATAAAAVAEARSRVSVILGTARAASGTAVDSVKAGILEYAVELAADEAVTAEDAQRKISEKIAELVEADGTRATATADEQRAERIFAAPSNPDAVLSRQDIISVFGEAREDRSLYRHAAESVSRHVEVAGDSAMNGMLKDLEGRTGLLRIHDESGGRPTVRTVTASSANVAIQSVLTALLLKSYNLRPPVTDIMVTQIMSNANEDTLPEVETEAGVTRIKEGDPYPLMSGSDRDVKVGHVKYGAAIAQTRENSIFDRVGRVTVHLTSLARQLRQKRDQFRLARMCDYSGFDGRYISHFDDNNGAAAFYSTDADHRGNSNSQVNELADETDIGVLVQKLEGMKLLDGSYVLPELKVILVDPTLKALVWKILNSIYAPSASGQFMLVNPYGPEGMLNQLPTVISHPLVGTYAGATTTWLGGDPSQQFYEKIVWDIEVAPVMVAGDIALRDIVNLWKGSFCIDMVALSNMFFVKNTNA